MKPLKVAVVTQNVINIVSVCMTRTLLLIYPTNLHVNQHTAMVPAELQHIRDAKHCIPYTVVASLVLNGYVEVMSGIKTRIVHNIRVLVTG